MEATARNTGISLAMIAAQKGYKVIVVVPGKFSIEKQIMMKDFVAGTGGGYCGVVKVLKENNPDVVI